MNGESLNITQDNLDKLQLLFPDIFSEGKIDMEKFKATFTDDINFANERYVLNWAGKSDAFKVLQIPTTATLKPQPDQSINFDTTQNVFIEGENLEVLKVLQKSYYGKVKVVSIDPPYNTGSDSFIYPDSFKENKADYEKRIGDKDEEGYLMKEGLFRKNSKDSGHYHSNWLSMMYPRLFLAKNLLRDDGVIFIHIDDNEVHNLRLLMNEIFGEENFITEIVWQRTFATKNDSKYFSTEHEYILLYAKSISGLTINLLERGEKQNIRYQNPDNDERGPWTSTDLLRMEHRDNSVYTIVSPNGKKWTPQSGTSWRHPETEMLQLIANNEVTFGSDGNAKPRRKRFLSEVKQGIIPQTIWKHDEVSHTQEAKQSLNKLFDGVPVFSTPKPIKLIRKMLQISTAKESNDFIVDFFAGSAATAEAVIEQNKDDGGNRKFILVQLPELCEAESEAFKVDYKTIADISKERIGRAIKKIEKEIKGNKNLLNGEENKNLDLGFKVFKLSPSNFKIWRGNEITEENLVQQLDAFTNPVRAESKNENMLFELILKAGYLLTDKIELKEKFYAVNNGELIIALEEMNEKIIGKIISAQPKKVIALDNLFTGNDQLKTNIVLQMKDAGIDFKTI
ncbi:MAG: site-specific DNA-methyltransferase [Cytophagales bacterium]|nr:site-specific DNA-methyltransferase [Cytophagales bacterium]